MFKKFIELFKDTHTKDELDFLPAAQEVLETPASPTGRTLMFLLCTLFFLAFIWAFIGKIDIVSVARGRIIPTERVKNIQPFEKGIIKSIYVTEGQEVKSGDLLVELNPTENKTDENIAEVELIGTQLNLDRLSQLVKAIKGQDGLSSEYIPTPIEGAQAQQLDNQKFLYKAALNSYYSKIEGVKEELAQKKSELRVAGAEIKRYTNILPLVRERMERLKSLSENKYVSRMDYLNTKQEYVDTRESLARQRKSRNAVKHSIEVLNQKLINTKSDQDVIIRREIDETRTRMMSLKQSLDKYTERASQSKILSPIDGFVQQLAISTVGGVVAPAQQLMVIVPKNGGLEVEAFIENKDIGFIEPAQEVAIKIDTFKFTKYGLIKGEVMTLSRDAVLQESQQEGLPPMRPEEQMALYKARIKLGKTSIRVDGRDVPLSAGMTVTAEIKTGKQRVIEYILSPLLRYKDEAMRER